MMKFSILIIILFSLNDAIAQDWQWIKPKPKDFHSNSIKYVDTNTGYAVGAYGKILKTINGGKNWDTLNSGIKNKWLRSVYFINVDTGYAVGDYGIIIKTINGGENWTIQTSGFSWINRLGSVYFIQDSNGSNTGYAVGDYSIILKTIDGGINWTKQYYRDSLTQKANRSEMMPDRLQSVFFLDSNIGYAVGGFVKYCDNVHGCTYNLILKTTNGGNKWTILNEESGGLLYSVYFTDSNNGYAVGEESVIYKTTNGGKSWSKKRIDPYRTLLSVFFTNKETGYVLGSNSIIFKTIDGGSNWFIDKREFK